MKELYALFVLLHLCSVRSLAVQATADYDRSAKENAEISGHPDGNAARLDTNLASRRRPSR
jgi:hypothetical protein